jgi:hypothetical protein
VAESLKRIAASIRIVEAAGDAHDSADHLAAGYGLEDFVEVGQNTQIESAEPEEQRVESWPDPVDAAAYYGPIGELTKAIEPHTEADPAGVLVQMLIGFGNLIGAGPRFMVGGAPHRTKTNCVLVGPTSGGRKGSGLDQVRRVLSAVDEPWERERVQGGLSTGEGLIHAVRDRKTAQKTTKGGDSTTVVVDEGVQDKRLLCVEPEFSRFLKVSAREGNPLSEVVRQAWDGSNLRVMTKAEAVATGAHISIVGHITTEELLRQLDDNDAANGLANRFLWVAVRRARMLPDGGAVDMDELTPVLDQLRRATTEARRTAEMTRDSGARELWHAEYPGLTTAPAGLLGGLLSRAAPHVLRLSMIYALADSSATIKRQHLEAALAAWDYAARSARFIFSCRLGDPTADALLEALRAALPGEMSRKEVSDHFGRNKNASELQRAMGVLVRQNLATTRTDKAGGPGRPPEYWKAIERESRER